SSAVLHFAKDEQHWQSMVDEMWRVLKPGGLLFARLASSIGIENQIEPIEGRRYRLPDGSTRFLVDEAMLMQKTTLLNGLWVEPLKTVVVKNMRSMSNWCLRKGTQNFSMIRSSRFIVCEAPMQNGATLASSRVMTSGL